MTNTPGPQVLPADRGLIDRLRPYTSETVSTDRGYRRVRRRGDGVLTTDHGTIDPETYELIEGK